MDIVNLFLQNLIVFLVGISITNLMMVRYITWVVHTSFIGTIVEIEKDFMYSTQRIGSWIEL